MRGDQYVSQLNLATTFYQDESFWPSQLDQLQTHETWHVGHGNVTDGTLAETPGLHKRLIQDQVLFAVHAAGTMHLVSGSWLHGDWSGNSVYEVVKSGDTP